MQVVVKSWKNATEQHDKGSKTNENAYIKFERTFICLNRYFTIHWTSVCDEDEYELHAAVSSVHYTSGFQTFQHGAPPKKYISFGEPPSKTH